MYDLLHKNSQNFVHMYAVAVVCVCQHFANIFHFVKLVEFFMNANIL